MQSVASIPVPILQAPPPLEFISTERIQQLYTELPGIFARYTSRRQSVSTAGVPQVPGGSIANGQLKRERPDDAIGESPSAHKRRDTGESKGSTPAPSTPLGNSSPIQPISASMVQPGTPTHPIATPSLPGPSNNSPSMPPPAVPSMMSSAMSQDQVMATRQRQLQIRQAQVMAQQGMGEAGRQMSAGPSQGGMPGITGTPSLPPNQMAMLQALGPGAVQCFQILQNPQHPLVQYMIANVQGFQTAPLQQQIQQMQKVQVRFNVVQNFRG